MGSDDLDDPKVYVAPPSYEHEPSIIRYFGLVVTNQRFDNTKIPNLPECVAEDHKQMSEILSHPYICKYNEDDCIFLKDASLSALVNSMETMEGKIKKALREMKEQQEQNALTEELEGMKVEASSKKGEEDDDDISLGDQSAGGGTDDDVSVASKASGSSKISALTKNSAWSRKSKKSEGGDDDGSVGSRDSKGSKRSRFSKGSRFSKKSDTSNDLSTLPSTLLGQLGVAEHDDEFEEYDTKQDVKIQRQNLSKILRKQPPEACVAFFVYFCTHAVTIRKSGSGDGQFFLCKDSSWASSSKLRKSALSLPQFTAMLKRIPCNHKTVCLDVVHSKKPKDTLFRTRIMYPQPDIYDKVSNLGETTCIGSCMSGLTGIAAMKYAKYNQEEEEEDKRLKEMEEEAERKKRLAPIQKKGLEGGDEKKEDGGGDSSSKDDSTMTSVKQARRPKRDSMMIVRQEEADKERKRVSMIRRQETLKNAPNPHSKKEKFKKLAVVRVLQRLNRSTRRKLNKMVESWSNRCEGSET